MFFSIIIINYKTKQLTANCLKSLLALPFANKEIIVIDNNSNDGSAEFLKTTFNQQIKLIANQENLGFSKANNQGAKIAQGDYLLFLNSDTIIEEDIFNSCLKIFKLNKNIAIISPRLLTSDGKYQKAAFGYFPTIFRLISQKTKIDPQFNENNDYNIVDWVSGCALMIRREIFEQIKGWDENFFLYYEDIDLCKRVNQLGYFSAVTNKAKIIHLSGQSLKQSLNKRWHYFRSQDYYFKKHYGLIITLILKIIRLPYKLIIILRSSKNKDL